MLLCFCAVAPCDSKSMTTKGSFSSLYGLFFFLHSVHVQIGAFSFQKTSARRGPLVHNRLLPPPALVSGASRTCAFSITLPHHFPSLYPPHVAPHPP